MVYVCNSGLPSDSSITNLILSSLLLIRKSAPKFLLDVYKRLNAAESEGNGRYTRSIDDDDNDNFITDNDKEAIEQSDLIMTFLNKSKLAVKAPAIIAARWADHLIINRLFIECLFQKTMLPRFVMNMGENYGLTCQKPHRNQR